MTAPTDGIPLLEVRSLHIRFPAMKRHFFDRQRFVHAADDVSFTLERGRTLGLVGESGSGKTSVARGVMRLVKPASGDVLLDGESVLPLHGDALSAFRRRVQFIFQDPYSSLDPRKTASYSIEEAMKVHHIGDTARERRQKALESLQEVGLDIQHMERYPHEFSGGMRQRVMIASALACQPELLIADEPTTALDVTIQAQILDLMKKLQKEDGSSILLITHDLGVVAEMCTRVIVMYAGKIVEMAPVEKLFATPSHPYTQGLIASVPKLGSGVKVLPSIPGSVPDLASMPTGCRFAPRCKYATDKCREQEPELLDISEDQKCRCWRTQEG